MRHFFSCFIFVFTFSAVAQPKEVSGLIEKFDRTMVQCPAQIWSNYDWGGKAVVMVYPSQSSSWIWDVDTKTTQSVDNKDLPAGVVGSYYNFFKWNGRPALSLNMELIGESAFEFGVHEFFHDQAQLGWVTPSGRGTNYPALWEPRVYRRMIFDHLMNYFKTGLASDLRKARFWYDKWLADHADESATSTDGYEGTARYVEAMGLFVSKLGCAADDVQLKAEAMDYVTTNINFTASFDGSSFELDAEGYAMGGLASLILRFSNAKLADWNSAVAKGKTPLDILLEGAAPVSDELPANLAADYAATGKRINQERGALLDEDINRWTNKGFVRVALRLSWLQSNLMPMFFAHSTALNLDLFPFSQEHRMISPAGSSNYSVAPKTVGFYDDQSPCQSSSVVTLVMASDIQAEDGLMTLTSPAVNGTIKGEYQTAGGFTYLCAVE